MFLHMTTTLYPNAIATTEQSPDSVALSARGRALAAVVPIAFASDTISTAIMVAGAAAFPVDRGPISRGKGHAVVHQQHAHH